MKCTRGMCSARDFLHRTDCNLSKAGRHFPGKIRVLGKIHGVIAFQQLPARPGEGDVAMSASVLPVFYTDQETAGDCGQGVSATGDMGAPLENHCTRLSTCNCAMALRVSIEADATCGRSTTWSKSTRACGT